jgi:uncharacterized membrane protein
VPGAVRRLGGWIRTHPGGLAIACLGVCWGLTMHSMGWAQFAHFAQVQAFSEGRAEIDEWHWSTNDKAWVDGHFYSVKSPGVAAVSLPAYLALDATFGDDFADMAASNAREAEYPRWSPGRLTPLENFGFDPRRADRVELQNEHNAPLIWALALLVAVIPAVALLFGVRWAANRFEPGYGTAAAITLGLGSIILSFGAEYFSHVIAAALGFAAFAVLMREREGPPSLRALAGAGLLAGLAVSFEYQVGLVGVVLFFYALAGRDERVKRGAVYAGAALLGALPALAFNWWALGSPLEFAYGSAVAEPGFSGHDTLGLNSDGFFGITVPKPASAIDLLVANRGLLTLTPVFAAAVAGLVMMWRRGRHRPEVATIAAVGIVYFLYNAGYWLAFGGGSPGPRFLIPALPFVALGLATAYRRIPAITLALAIPSVVTMGAAAMSFPLLGEQGPGEWADFIEDGHLEHTLLTAFGVSNAWIAIAPAVLAAAGAVAFAVAATPRSRPEGLAAAALCVLAWAAIAVVGPSVAGDKNTPLGEDGDALALFAIGAGASLLVLGLLGLRRRFAQPELSLSGEPALEAPRS